MSAESGIRTATSEDVSAAIRLLAEAGLPTDDVELDRLALAAIQDGRLAGVIGLEQFGPQGLLRSLVVAPGARGIGLGGQLVDALEEVAMARGLVDLWLLTIDADRFFEKLGYRRQSRDSVPAAIATTREFSTLCPGDAVLMKKNLLS